MRIIQRIGSTSGLAALLVLACAPSSPEERISQLRERYTAELNGFIVKQTPIESVAGTADAESASDVGGDEEPMPPATRTDILLDLLVQHDAPERLPGVTVDVTMVDADQVEKNRWLIWVETADLVKATKKQVSHEVTGVDYEEGDGFYAEIRHPIPAAERADYREFASSGG